MTVDLPVPLYILAGGDSKRFGTDKARAELRGTPLVVRVARLLSPAARPATVVARSGGRYADLGLHTIADIRPGLGPMGGLDAALVDCAAPWLLLVSCDLVRPLAPWVRILADAAEPDRPAALRDDTGWQPLFALYPSAVRSVLTRLLIEGRSSLQDLLDETAAVAVPMPDDASDPFQVNTPGDLERAAAQPPM